MSRGLSVTQGWRGHVVVMSHGWRGQIEVMSHGLSMTRGHHTGAIAMSHGGTWMEETRSDVTWTQRDMRTCHSMTRGQRGHVVVMSRG